MGRRSQQHREEKAHKRAIDARAKRAAMIAKHKPKCPDCDTPFTEDCHVNRCAFCGWFICDECAGTPGKHKCKVKLRSIGGRR